MMPYPRTDNKLYNLILETAEMEEEAGKLLLKIDENKKKLEKVFDEKDIKEINVPIGPESIENSAIVKCKKVERCTIKYDVDKLKERLDDELFVEATNRTYIITDINKMIGLMKDAGVKSSRFKELVDVKIVPNNSAIKQLYDVGEISMKQLKGTYSATISKSIKISEEKGGKD